MKKSILNKLIEKNICFAVCIAETVWIQGERFIDMRFKEYFVIVAKADLSTKDGKPKYGFNEVECRPNILEKSLLPSEIEGFKSNLGEYNKVIHDRNGRVYELKTQSFKKHFNSLYPKNTEKPELQSA